MPIASRLFVPYSHETVRGNAVCPARYSLVPNVTSNAYLITFTSPFADVREWSRGRSALLWWLGADSDKILGADFVLAPGLVYGCTLMGT